MTLLPETRISQSATSQTVISQTAISWYRQAYSRGGSTAALAALLLAAGGLSPVPKASAQTSANQPVPTGASVSRNGSGSVQIDSNAFTIETGALDNSSNIPLPADLPETTREAQPLPVIREQLAPNSVDIRPSVGYIDQAFNDRLSQGDDGLSYTLESDTLQLTTQFDLGYSQGNHAYGEGIQVSVFGPDGELKSQEAAFVRGDRITVDQNGQPLPESAQIGVTYGAADTVELRVLNIRQDGAAPTESGVYFAQDGSFIVEDRQNGGDLDFNDGQYEALPGGQGEAIALEERTDITYDTQVAETPLAPALRQEATVETELAEDVILSDTVSVEETIRGEIETPDAAATRLGHASGVRTESNQQLVYGRYAGIGEVRIGSDGLGVAGQLAPLVSNPNVPPTLLTGGLTFDPTARDNEAGLTTSLGITQFFTPTHRPATDVLGNVIVNPDPDGPRLIEPVGLFNNRRMVGYVPATPSPTVQSSQLFPVSGIFDLPADMAVVIEPASPQQVGRGDSAYTDNVGGLLIESFTGEVAFLPQWTKDGYAEGPVALEAGEAQRIIYALVPQQPGQALQLGQRYPVVADADGYRIVDGGFRVIAADRQPQNFVQEQAEIYAVEDTLAGQNAITPMFNGIQGVYLEAPGGDRIPTVDVSLADQADARVGNVLSSLTAVAAEQGQSGYAQTTLAGGFYLGAALSGGVGNQRDTVSQTRSTVERAADELRTRRTVNTFATPLVQRNTLTTQITETTQSSGSAFFDIDSKGELTNARFMQTGDASAPIITSVVEQSSSLERGEEQLVSSVTEETVELTDIQLISMDQETTETTESYPNFSPISGELALGGVLNFGNTPWTAAANTVRAELFARDTVFGRSSGTETGLRAEVVFHPFGEVQRDAYQYDAAGNAVAVYQTEPVLDAAGQRMIEVLTSGDKAVEMPVNQFAIDESGDRIAQQVGTGRPQGPGVYLRLEDVLNDSDSAIVAGGIQFSF